MSPTKAHTILIRFTLALALVWGQQAAFAQEGPALKESLPPGAPEPAAQPATLVTTESEEPATTAALAPHRPGLRFGMNMGTMVSSFGSASYLSPTASYHLSPRFRVFGSMSMVHLQYAGLTPVESTMGGAVAPFRNNQMFLQAGGQYDASDRLTLTGSVWRDLSTMPASYQGYRQPMMPGGSGMSLRADLKITDHLSVSGGLRYGNGNRNNFGHPMFFPGTLGHGPFGY